MQCVSWEMNERRLKQRCQSNKTFMKTVLKMFRLKAP